MNGTIKRLVSDKGFGFILADNGDESFFHGLACKETRLDDLREAGRHVRTWAGPEGAASEDVKVA